MNKGTKTISLIISYLREHIKVISLILIIFLINTVIFYLYSLPFEPILYFMILVLTVGILYFVVNFIVYYKRHNQLMNMRKMILEDNVELPAPRTVLEEDYTKLIEILDGFRTDLLSKTDMEKENLMEYCTMWAHQIKTPIAAMRLYIQCKGIDEDKELLIEFFKIEQYVEMILQYVRMQDMNNDIKIEEYDLYDIVKDAVKKYSKIFIRKNIRLNLQPFDKKVLTDNKWISFVIEQILSNSLKYTKSGTISIYIDSINSDTLIIEDTGIGIEAEDLPRVFEKGFTGYNGRSHRKSTGIGLYLCNEIIKKLSHGIRIESKPDKGTKVYIDFSVIKLENE